MRRYPGPATQTALTPVIHRRARAGSCGSRRPDTRDGLLHQRRLPLDRLRVPGLGLPTAAALTQAHHATLTISPRPGGGLNIDVTFPTATRPTFSAPCMTSHNRTICAFARWLRATWIRSM